MRFILSFLVLFSSSSLLQAQISPSSEEPIWCGKGSRLRIVFVAHGKIERITINKDKEPLPNGLRFFARDNVLILHGTPTVECYSPTEFTVHFTILKSGKKYAITYMLVSP